MPNFSWLKRSSVLAALTVATPLLANPPYAVAVVASRVLNGNVGNSYPDPSKALGAADDAYVSLGGPGGYLVLDFGAATPVVDGPGADLEVREIGAAQSSGSSDERYRVSVSNSPDLTTFIPVGEGQALSLLDISGSGLASARYVLIEDLSTTTQNCSTPGSDIDSVRALHSSASSAVAPPTAATTRLFGQGVAVSWQPSPDSATTGYAIRRSLDGVNFGSAQDVVLTSQETTFYDTSLLQVGNCYYSVAALCGTAESVPVIASLMAAASQVDISTGQIYHLGNDYDSSWATPAFQPSLTVSFTLPAAAPGPCAELRMEVFNVDYDKNLILLNGGRIGAVPVQSPQAWAAKSLRFPAGMLVPGVNTLQVFSCNSSGVPTGSMDDFQIRNIRLVRFE